MHIFLILGKILYLFFTYLDFYKNYPSTEVAITNSSLEYYYTLPSTVGGEHPVGVIRIG